MLVAEHVTLFVTVDNSCHSRVTQYVTIASLWYRIVPGFGLAWGLHVLGQPVATLALLFNNLSMCYLGCSIMGRLRTIMYQVAFISGGKLTAVNTPDIHAANTLAFTLFMAGVNVRLWRMNKGAPKLLA